jgi:hypothetical protein
MVANIKTTTTSMTKLSLRFQLIFSDHFECYQYTQQDKDAINSYPSTMNQKDKKRCESIGNVFNGPGAPDGVAPGCGACWCCKSVGSGWPKMHDSSIYGCPGKYCTVFPATNIFTLEEDVWSNRATSNRASYWLAANHINNVGFTIELGSSPLTITGVRLKNTHNGRSKDRSTKKFRLFGALESGGPWTALMEQSLEDSRQQASPPVQQFSLEKPAEMRFLKFELLEHWGHGGGLQYFEAEQSGNLLYHATALLLSELPILSRRVPPLRGCIKVDHYDGVTRVFIPQNLTHCRNTLIIS